MTQRITQKGLESHIDQIVVVVRGNQTFSGSLLTEDDRVLANVIRSPYIASSTAISRYGFYKVRVTGEEKGFNGRYTRNIPLEVGDKLSFNREGGRLYEAAK